MKLRNKKTGEIIEYDEEVIYYRKLTPNGHEDWTPYHPEDWEDYVTAEPLIKDEKIRKAVRAWAEADDLDNFRVQNQHFNACKIIGYTAGINKASFIGFQTTIAHADKKLHTIVELCGEEEECTRPQAE